MDPIESREIRIRGAREHNLKGVDVSIPRERFVVITGPSQINQKPGISRAARRADFVRWLMGIVPHVADAARDKGIKYRRALGPSANSLLSRRAEVPADATKRWRLTLVYDA